MEIAARAGLDPRVDLLPVSPAEHFHMGGIATDQRGRTSVSGLYACGECDYGYHGANRLGANSLLSASYSGRVAGESVAAYLKGLGKHSEPLPQSASDAEVRRAAVSLFGPYFSCRRFTSSPARPACKFTSSNCTTCSVGN